MDADSKVLIQNRNATIKKRLAQSQRPVANVERSIQRCLPTNSLGFQIKRYNYGKILSYNVCFFVTDLVTWQTDEKHGILYWASIVIFAIFLTTLAIMLLYFIGAIILLLITMVTDTSPIW